MKKYSKKIKNVMTPYEGLPKEIYILFIAHVVNAVGAFVYPLLTLILTKKLGFTKEETGLWVLVAGIAMGVAGLIGGKLIDTFGRKRVLVIFNFLSISCYILCAIFVNHTEIIYLLILSGFFAGVCEPCYGTIIADLTTPENRDASYSLSYMGFNLGFAVGPLIGGMLFENHLRWLFIGDAVTAFIALSLIAIFIKETIHKTEEKLDNDRELEKREDGSILGVLLDRPILVFFALAALGYYFVYAQWGFLMPLHVEHNFINEGAKIYGKMGSFNGLIVIAFTPILTTLLMKIKNIRRIVVGGILYAVGFGMLGFISTKGAFFTSVLIFTIGEIIITISLMPFLANHTPASHRGRMNAVLPLIMGAGHTVSPFVIGYVLKYSSMEMAWRYIGIVMIISTIAMAFIDKKETLEAQDTQELCKEI
ncbi:MFS transporter [Clostridium sediminicola]|uniref:MFS transporter n=1 Tax=Clostridium sediminicola TaxID=3114879 RepID=UPI0031F1F5F2